MPETKLMFYYVGGWSEQTLHSEEEMAAALGITVSDLDAWPFHVVVDKKRVYNKHVYEYNCATMRQLRGEGWRYWIKDGASLCRDVGHGEGVFDIARENPSAALRAHVLYIVSRHPMSSARQIEPDVWIVSREER